MAFTKKVRRKGSVTQNHSGEKMISATHATRDTKKINQYILRFSTFSVFTCDSITMISEPQTYSFLRYDV